MERLANYFCKTFNLPVDLVTTLYQLGTCHLAYNERFIAPTSSTACSSASCVRGVPTSGKHSITSGMAVNPYCNLRKMKVQVSLYP